MADVFLSYTRADQAIAGRVAEALTRRGYSVFYDVTVAPGDSWDRRIETELAAARRVVVLWSGQSVGRQWVRNEAREGMRRRILCPALIGACAIPVEFSHIQAADLRGWRGEDAHAGFAALVAALESGQNVPAFSSPTSRRWLMFGALGAAAIGGAAFYFTRPAGEENPEKAALPVADNRYDASGLHPRVLEAVIAARNAAREAQTLVQRAREDAAKGEEAAARAARGAPGTMRYTNTHLTWAGEGQGEEITGYGMLTAGMADEYAGLSLAFDNTPSRFAGRFRDRLFPAFGVKWRPRDGGGELMVQAGNMLGNVSGVRPAHAVLYGAEGGEYAGLVGWQDIPWGPGVDQRTRGERREGEFRGALEGPGVVWDANGQVLHAGIFDGGELTTALGAQGAAGDSAAQEARP